MSLPNIMDNFFVDPQHLDEFTDVLKSSADTFQSNMINLGLKYSLKSAPQWMQMFLDWMEWQDENMHEACWPETTPFCECENPIKVYGLKCDSCWSCQICLRFGGCDNQESKQNV